MIQVAIKHKDKPDPTFVIGLDPEDLTQLENKDVVILGQFKQFKFAITVVRSSKTEFLKHLEELGAEYASRESESINGHAQ